MNLLKTIREARKSRREKRAMIDWEFNNTNGKYEEVLVVTIRCHPLNLWDVWASDYFDYRLENALPPIDFEDEFEEDIEYFEERILFEILEEKDFSTCAYGYGGFTASCDADIRRKGVKDRWFKLVFLYEKKFSLNPFYKKTNSKIKYIKVAGKKVKTYSELEEAIRTWLDKLKR